MSSLIITTTGSSNNKRRRRTTAAANSDRNNRINYIVTPIFVVVLAILSFSGSTVSGMRMMTMTATTTATKSAFQHASSSFLKRNKVSSSSKVTVAGFCSTTKTAAAQAMSMTASAAVATTSTTTSLQQSQDSDENNVVELKHVEFSSDTTAIDENQQQRKNYHPHTKPSPVLMLHGLLGNKRNFATVANSLSAQLERKRRILSLDLRNHGENHHDWRDDMNYKSMAKDVIAFMDKHEMEKSVLVGHSMGGKVAQAMALLEPNRVDGLVVLDIAPVQYHNHEPHWKAVHDIVWTLQNSVITAGGGGDGGGETTTITKQQLDKILRPSIPDPAIRAFCLTNWNQRTGSWKVHLDAIVSQLETLAGFDIDDTTTGNEERSSSANESDTDNNDNSQQQQQYHGDAFFIHGGQSRFVRSSYLPTISGYFPNHLLTTVKGAGHWIHAEAPDDTTALLKKYLDR